MKNRLDRVIEAIDNANAKDPNTSLDGDTLRPAELVYGERMSATLGEFCEIASEHLQIAARAQHIERWTSRRNSYPAGREGYLKWRSDLKAFHARKAGELMEAAGYDQTDIDRVAILISKKGIKRDPEVQTLEDVVCLVFLKYYASDFIAQHQDDKVADILRKTARKMSPDGIAAATRLSLSERLGRLLTRTVSEAS